MKECRIKAINREYCVLTFKNRHYLTKLEFKLRYFFQKIIYVTFFSHTRQNHYDV